MKPAQISKRLFEETKLLIIDPKLQNGITHTKAGQLSTHLRAGDVLVVNNSGTLPSSFRGKITRTGEQIEIRLASFRGTSTQDLSTWAAVAFGEGTWNTATENRVLPPALRKSDRIEIGDDLCAHITEVDGRFRRLLQIKFESKSLIQKLYEHGRPIQYSYLKEDLNVWDQQTLFGGIPLSVEPPSASFPLRWEQILKLKQNGILVTTLLHGAGLSSTGDSLLDAQLPLKEYYEIPEETLQLILQARKTGARIIALGTTVARALESAFAGNIQKSGYTSLKLGAHSILHATTALITGMHEEGTSHAELMKAYCNCELLKAAELEAHLLDYRSHEYGDWTLLDCNAAPKIKTQE